MREHRRSLAIGPVAGAVVVGMGSVATHCRLPPQPAGRSVSTLQPSPAADPLVEHHKEQRITAGTPRNDNTPGRTPGQNMTAALSFAGGGYNIANQVILTTVQHILRAISQKPEMAASAVVAVSRWDQATPEFLRAVLAFSPIEAAVYPASRLLQIILVGSAKARKAVGGLS